MAMQINYKSDHLLMDGGTPIVKTETLSAAGAASLTTLVTFLSVTGTKAYTLADGVAIGQVKHFICTVAASTPAGTLTPANFANGTSILFDATGETLSLVWDGSNWQRLHVTGATIS